MEGARLKAFLAACAARLAPPFGALGGGGGGVDLEGGEGAEDGGKGGVGDTGGGGAWPNPEGLRDVGSGGFLPGGGGFGFIDISSEDTEAIDDGRRLLLRLAMDGMTGAEPGGGGGAPPGNRGAPGGFGADPNGGLGAEFLAVSGSDMYGD